jgi:DNA mismatch endonuclease (patch repair protein)
MSRVRQRDTEPELQVKRALDDLGFALREHDGDLPGRPDIVVPRLGAVIQVHGCFWHGHACPRGQLPATNKGLWEAKIRRNRRRDQASARQLRALGWCVFTLWECRLRAFGAEALLLRIKGATLRARTTAAGERRLRQLRSLAPAGAGPRSRSALARQSTRP